MTALRRAVLLYLQLRLPVEIALLLTPQDVPQARGCVPGLDGPSFLHRLFVWDSGHYVRILREGYVYTGPTEPSNMAFYPLYPMAAKLLTLLGAPMSVSFIVVTHVALIAAIAGLLQLAQTTGKFDGEKAAVAMLFFPTSFFLSAAYSEALFIMITVWGLYAMEKRQPGLAFVLAAAAVLCRANGMATAGVMALMAALRKDWRGVAVVSAGVAAGLGGYMVYQAITFDEPLAFLRIRGMWGGSRLRYAVEVLQGMHAMHGWLDLFTIPFLAVTGVVAWRRLGAPYGLLVLGTLAMPLAIQQIWSFSRIAMSAVPAFMVMGTTPWHPVVRRVFPYLSVALFGVSAYRLVHCYWVS